MDAARKNVISTIFLLLFSTYIAIEAYRLGLGRWSMPGPGYFPFLAGVTLGAISLGLLIRTLLKESRHPKADDRGAAEEPLNWKNIVLTLAGMLAYVGVLHRAGFIVSTLLLMGFYIRVIGNRRWSVALIASVSITLASYLLFELALDAQLPKGIFEVFY